MVNAQVDNLAKMNVLSSFLPKVLDFEVQSPQFTFAGPDERTFRYRTGFCLYRSARLHFGGNTTLEKSKVQYLR